MFGWRVADPAKDIRPLPAPPPADVWPPFQKMDGALEAALRLFTQALEQAGQDCGGLGVRGPVPACVARLLADCVVYEGSRGRGYLTLGLTPDFKAFTYQPHCRLFLMLNCALLLEDPVSSDLRAPIAVAQVPRLLVEVQMMKRWIKYIRAAGTAASADDGDELRRIVQDVVAELTEIAQQAPAWIGAHVNLRDCVTEWCSGFPAAIGRPLSADVRRLNDLPMTDFVEKMLTEFLIQTQMRGVAARRRA